MNLYQLRALFSKSMKVCAYHTAPLSIFQVFVRRPADALGLVQAEQAVVELPDNVLRAEEVIESPLLPECTDVCAKDGCGVWPEVARLVHSDEQVFDLQRLKLEIARLGFVSECRWVERVFWVPCHRAPVYTAASEQVSTAYSG